MKKKDTSTNTNSLTPSSIRKIKIKPQTQDLEGFDFRWWLTEKDMYKNIMATVSQIYDAQASKREEMLSYLKIYLNQDIGGLNSWVYSRGDRKYKSAKISLNMSKACVDTAAAKISKQRPRALFFKDNASFIEKQVAKRLSSKMELEFQRQNVYETAEEVFKDASIFDLGAMKWYKRDGKIKFERVLPFELLADEADCVYGAPRNIFQLRWINRDVLTSMFPKHAEDIARASIGIKSEQNLFSASDMILAVEAWSLDGKKHAICTDTCTLLVEEYTKELPFIFYRWNTRPIGLFGQGIISELYGIQHEINRSIDVWQKGIRLMAVPRVILSKASGVNPDHITNDVGSVIEYNEGATPPQFITPVAFGAELPAYIQNLYTKGFEIVGISQMSAGSVKPKGLDSGKALREYHDIESERFSIQAMRWERFFLEIAKVISIHSGDEDFRDYDLKVFPVGILPSEPAGKLASIMELINAGFIQREDALGLLDFPDLDGYQARETSLRQAMVKDIFDMVETLSYRTPDLYISTEDNVKAAIGMYYSMKNEGLKEKEQELILSYIEDMKATILQQQSALMAQQQALMPAPPAQELQSGGQI